MKQGKTFYLGVEGGGTKSTVILADEKTILEEREGPQLNYHSIGAKTAAKNLARLLKSILKRTERGTLYAVFGFAGLDTEKDETVYRRIAATILPKGATFKVVNDAEIALEARCPEQENRILVIAGTGSTVYGQNKKQTAKTIGWDFVLGDEGSGYEVGLKVLKAATQSWDGRAKKSVLQRLVPQKANVSTMENFIPKFYKVLHNPKQDQKSFIASFAPLVDKAILRRDWAALNIRQQTLENLVLGASTVANKLSLKQKKFSVGFMGSLWNMPGLREQFQKEIKLQFPKARFSNQTSSGAWGALLLARKLATKKEGADKRLSP